MTVTSVILGRRRVVAITTVAAALLAAGAGTSAASAAGPDASCVGLITSYEGSQLPAGSIGAEVSGLAHSVPRLGAAAVSPLARAHLGSIAECSS